MMRPGRAAAGLAVAAAAAGAGVVLGFAHRRQQLDPAATVVLAAATVLTLVVVVSVVVAGRRPGGLVVRPGQRLPTPAWWPPVLLVGLADLAGGVAASPPLAVVGVVLVAVALVDLGRRLMAPRALPDRRIVALARRVQQTCGADAQVSSTVPGLGRVRVICTGDTGRVDGVLRDGDEVAVLTALVGRSPVTDASV